MHSNKLVLSTGYILMFGVSMGTSKISEALLSSWEIYGEDQPQAVLQKIHYRTLRVFLDLSLIRAGGVRVHTRSGC